MGNVGLGWSNKFRIYKCDEENELKHNTSKSEIEIANQNFVDLEHNTQTFVKFRLNRCEGGHVWHKCRESVDREEGEGKADCHKSSNKCVIDSLNLR